MLRSFRGAVPNLNLSHFLFLLTLSLWSVEYALSSALTLTTSRHQLRCPFSMTGGWNVQLPGYLGWRRSRSRDCSCIKSHCYFKPTSLHWGRGFVLTLCSEAVVCESLTSALLDSWPNFCKARRRVIAPHRYLCIKIMTGSPVLQTPWYARVIMYWTNLGADGKGLRRFSVGLVLCWMIILGLKWSQGRRRHVSRQYPVRC